MQFNKRQVSMFVAICFSLVIAVSAFQVGRVYATTGCFPDTNGHWAETFICWLKDNGITSGYPDGTYKPENSVTRAEMSIFLQKIFNLADSSAQTKATTAENNAKAYADSLVNTPPSTGVITISENHGNWIKYFDTDNTSFSNYSSTKYVYKATTGSAFIALHPTLPTILYGKSLQLTAVEFCYTATATVMLNYIEINVPTHAAAPSADQGKQFSDNTDRTDSICRYYALPAPVTLTADMVVDVYVAINWASSDAFQVGRTTFVLQPTGTTAVIPSSIDSANVTILSAGSAAGDDIPSTTP